MLLLALRFAGWRIRPARVALGALLGALCAQAAAPLSRAQRMLLWLPVAQAMMIAAGGRRAARAPLRAAGLLLCAAGLLRRGRSAACAGRRHRFARWWTVATPFGII